MQTKNRFLDDIAKVANTAISTLAGVKHEIEAIARYQFENYISTLDLVSRDEFEATKAMATEARIKQENMQKRIEQLEAQLANNIAKKSAYDQKSPKKSKQPKRDQP